MRSCEYYLNLNSPLNYNKPIYQSDECNINAGARIILNGKTLFVSELPNVRTNTMNDQFHEEK